jgi:signal transduction histidine kinase/ActR/RegA family two-component response regulator
LTQQYGGSHLDPPGRAAHFLKELREEGERMVFADRLQHAEELFALSLALYDRFFPTMHFEGIAAARRLSELLSEEKRDAELARALDYAYEIVKRLDGENVAVANHGAIGDALVRRHQIAAYVDIVAQKKALTSGETKPLQVLVVEDNEDDAELVKDALASTETLQIETERAQMLADAIDRLRNGNIDVVVLDLTLPDSNSLRTLQKIRDRAPSVPIVILTGHDDDDFALRAIKSGAHDYLVKSRTTSGMVLRSVLRAAEDRFTPKMPDTPWANVNSFIEFAPHGMMHLSNDLTVYATNSAFVDLVGADWTGRSVHEVWPEFNCDRLIEATERGGGVELSEMQLPPSSVHKGSVDVAIWPTRTPDGLTDGMICMITGYEVPALAGIDGGERISETRAKQLQAQIMQGRREEQRLRNRVAQQTALATISQLAQGNLEAEQDLFQQATTAAAQAVGADLVLLMECDEHAHLRVKACSTEITPAILKLEADIDPEPLYTFAYNSAGAVIVDDFNEEVFARPPKPLLDLGIKSGTIVHLKGRHRPYGLLCAFYKETHRVQEGEPMFLAALATILAASIERTLSESRLDEIAAELSRSNSDLQQFAYAAAHDLQEPLRSVVSYLELLQNRLDGKLDEKSEKYMSVAMSAGKRMQSLIRDLLEYSRISTRGQSLARTDMAQVVQFAIDNLHSHLQEVDADVKVDALPMVSVDVSQMVQVMQNLIGNALKFKHPDQKPQIKIWSEQKPSEFEFVIKDNGIGMDMEYADRIFVIFQRLHTRQKYGGTGIGLALCKKIIERHGGRIWVESKPDSGSEFHFTLPTRG